MASFTEYQAFQKLTELAKSPIDLTKEGVLTPKRLTDYQAASCGYKLLYGTERVTDEVCSSLFALAEEAQAILQMEKMQAGEIVNKIEGFKSEERPALHTATRDFFEPNSSRVAQEMTALARAEVDKLKAFLEDTEKSGSYSDLITIGIGGSDLGPRANYLALERTVSKKRKVHFISNIDPDDPASVLNKLDLKRCLVVVISKSGTTLETRTNEAFVRQAFEKQGLAPKKHFIAITGKNSPMDDPSRYLESFYIWDWIGGRYSSTSMVGGVLLAFAFGFDIFWQFLQGASQMDKRALIPTLEKNLPLVAALLGIWNRNFLHLPTLAVIPYSQALVRFPAHIQQLDMESNGKRITRLATHATFSTGPIIWGEVGTNSQHSFFQLIHQGTDTIPIEFVGFRESQLQEDLEFEGTPSQKKLLANLFAQCIALAKGKSDENPNKTFPGNRPSHILLGRQLTPHALGALLSFFEHKVAFQGFIWGINSFDQEGVQLGKVLANRILERFQNKGQPFPLADAFLQELDTLS